MGRGGRGGRGGRSGRGGVVRRPFARLLTYLAKKADEDAVIESVEETIGDVLRDDRPVRESRTSTTGRG